MVHVNKELILTPHEQTQEVWPVEGSSEMQILSTFIEWCLDVEIKQRTILPVLIISHILEIVFENIIEMLSDESQIDWMAKT